MKKPVEGAGDTWTWTAIEADSKLLITWLVGGRDSDYAIAFMDDLRDRLANRVQLTSDGHKAYLEAVEGAFGADVDYAMLVKIFGAAPEGMKGRYSPADCIGARKERIEGNPDPKHVSTSYAERQNLTMRMQMRRFTRLTNAFSKKFENHMHMVALYTVWYNYVKQHKSLKGLSPAMAAGLSDTLWSITDLAGMIDAGQPKPGSCLRMPILRESMKLGSRLHSWNQASRSSDGRDCYCESSFRCRGTHVDMMDRAVRGFQ